MSLHLFGIRHHGPGCARALRRALDELRPDVIVMEGPADGEAALSLAGHADLKPPVAMLVYPPEEPRRGVYFPFAVFSPEWQSLRWAGEYNIPIRLMDLPQSHDIAIEKSREAAAAEESEPDHPEDADSAPDDLNADPPKTNDHDAEFEVRIDPLGLLAEAAGYRDRELWWEEQVERRTDATNLFTAIREAMATLREEMPAATRERDLLREAFMRKTLRAVQKEGFERIAVVCGAWHAPVLDEEALAGKREGCRIKDDNERLAGLPKIKTAVTWIPWTNSRLSYRSGYGAGIDSPGWYEHVWKSDVDAPTRWLTTAARLLREKDLDASSASVIESLRLADTLAALRELRSPGLTELNEAILSILCHGDVAPMRLIREELEIGHVLGEVPAETPSVPLAQDLAARQKSLRLKPSTASEPLDLDLRKETDLHRSHLLHRLTLLEIPWGVFKQAGGKSSTFHEIWQIEWKPEFAVAVIEASIWGSTIESAATARVVSRSADAKELKHVTALLQGAMLASLPEVIEPILDRIQTMAAQSTDVRHLMDALPALSHVARYGDVRGGPPKAVEHIVTGLFERAIVGLAAAASALDDEAAERLLESMLHVGQSLDLLQRDDLQSEWRDTLRRLMNSHVHALLRGWCCRTLLDQSTITPDELDRLARLGLSPANPPLDSTNWANGFLRGSGLVLLHQDVIWQVLDAWLASLSADSFTELLPLLRRSFSEFTGPERRQMGEKVKSLAQADEPATHANRRKAHSPSDVDAARADRILPILAHILGTDDSAKEP